MSDYELGDPKRSPAPCKAPESELTPDRWQTIKGLFTGAQEREPKDRSAYLRVACGGDEALLMEVESLLAAAVSEEATANAAKSPEQDSLIGRRIGVYKIERQIGSGGMASVYLARRADEEYQKQVAIKMLRPELDSGELLRRFRNERQTLATLDHPNIVKLLDGGSSENGLPYIVMDYVEGTPIDEFCDSHELSIEERLRLFSEVCAGVECAHRNLVIHRDLKPSNILITAEGTPKLLDFGIAKVLSPPDSSQPQVITQTRTRRMTPAYASPEQIKGMPVTTATDIYSLGVVLYELLTGHRPYKLKQTTPAELERAICEEEPENPSTAVDRVESTTSLDGTTVTITPEVVSRTREGEPEKLRRCLRGDLDTIVLMALQKEPQRRYASIQAFSEDIHRHLDHLPVKARRSTLAYRSSKFVKRHRMGVLTGALLVIVALGGALFSRWEEKRAAEKARAEVSGEHMPGRPTVAVLGFKNLSGRPETSWVSTAVSEMLTTELAAGGTLRTISGENVANMKSDLSLPETDSLARETLTRVRKHLGSDYVLLGSYLDLGGNGSQQVRLDVRLQDAAVGETIGVVAVNGVETDLPDLVVRAGASLRDKLNAGPVSPVEVASMKASQPSNPEALRLYAEGLAKLRAFDALGARDLLEKAVAADPSFALAHSALAEAWGTLGYDAKAKDEAKKGFDLAAGLPREESLLIEGRYRQAAREWDKAVEIYRTLLNFFPDNLDYGLRLAAAQIGAGKGKESLATIEILRKLPPPVGNDPLIDLQESRAAASVSDLKREYATAYQAAQKGEQRGSRLLVAQARLAEGSALRGLGDPKAANSASIEAKRLFIAVGDRFGEARAMRNIGVILADKGELDNGRKVLEESLKVQQELGNAAGESEVLGQIAAILYRQNNVVEAKQTSQRLLVLNREVGDRGGEAHTLNLIASMEQHQGDLPSATRHFHEALAICHEIGDESGAARIMNNLALVLMAQGDFPGAKKLLEECLRINRRTGNKDDVGIALLNLADLRFNHGEVAAAKSLYSDALKIFRETGNLAAASYALYTTSSIMGTEGDLVGARKGQEEALAIRERIGAKGDAAMSRASLADIALQDGHASDAESLARQAAEYFHAANDPGNEADADSKIADALRAQGKLSEAQIVVATAVQLAEKSDDRGAQFTALIADARIRDASGKTAEAMKLLKGAVQDASKAGFAELKYEAWLALGAMEMKSGNSAVGQSELKALEQEARTRGFLLIAREAAAARKQKTTSPGVRDSR